MWLIVSRIKRGSQGNWKSIKGGGGKFFGTIVLSSELYQESIEQRLYSWPMLENSHSRTNIRHPGNINVLFFILLSWSKFKSLHGAVVEQYFNVSAKR